MNSSIVSVDPEIMGGTPVFRGTRAPIRTLLDYVEGGETIEEFLEDIAGLSALHRSGQDSGGYGRGHSEGRRGAVEMMAVV